MASAAKRPKVAAESSTAEKGSVDPIAGFLAWCKKAGLELSPKVCVSREGTVADYGMLAAEDLQVGEVLFTIPRTALLSQYTSSIQALLQEARESLQSQSGWMPLLLALLHEYTTSSSHWQPYFSLWQDFRSLDHPMFWPEEERTRLLQGTGISEAVDKDLVNIHLEYSSIILPFMECHPDIVVVLTCNLHGESKKIPRVPSAPMLRALEANGAGGPWQTGAAPASARHLPSPHTPHAAPTCTSLGGPVPTTRSLLTSSGGPAAQGKAAAVSPSSTAGPRATLLPLSFRAPTKGKAAASALGGKASARGMRCPSPAASLAAPLALLPGEQATIRCWDLTRTHIVCMLPASTCLCQQPPSRFPPLSSSLACPPALPALPALLPPPQLHVDTACAECFRSARLCTSLTPASSHKQILV